MSPTQSTPGVAIATAAQRIRMCRTFPTIIRRITANVVLVDVPPPPLTKPRRPSIAVGHIGPRRRH